MTGRVTTFRVLGPIGADAGGEPVGLGGARQRAVLARLLVARGRVVPVDRLVADLWETPPDAAVAAIRTFVADLRRALEPGRPPRRPAELLITTPPGYALPAAPDAVDAWRFEAAVTRTGGHAADALTRLDDALALWRGPAYAEYEAEPWARAEIDRLNELRMLAVERRAEALLELGRAAEAVSDLQAHTAQAPLREGAWHLLATALYRAGRQGEALAALRRARDVLVGELGVDPGPRLRRLEADILAQAPHLESPPEVSVAFLDRPDAGPALAERPSGGPRSAGRPSTRPAFAERTSARRAFVGRAHELDLLEAAAGRAAAGDEPVVALISGEPGAGKSALAETVAARLAGRGWVVLWGRGPEDDGAPVAWPWTPQTVPAPGEDPAAARLRRRREAAARVAAAAGRSPVLLVADDLHRADADSLDLLTALDAGSGRVLVLGTYRATEIGPALTAALARWARTEPVRVYLGGLTEPEVTELVAGVLGRPAGAGVARAVHRRSGGNPFFARELARLHADGADLDDIPAGVRDVIRHRLARLPGRTRDVLRQASVLGRDVDPEVLGALAGDVVDALDDALAAGFLTEDGPRLRFAHILVRDTVYDDLSAVRRAHWHAAAGAAIERLAPGDAAVLAHHFGLAGNRATAPKAARYARTAAEEAERRSNPHEAARLWRQVLAAGSGDPAVRLAALAGLGRNLAVTGHLAETRALRAEAIAAVSAVGDPELTAAVLTGFDVPAIWPRNDDHELAGLVVAAAERVLPGAAPPLRSRLLSTLALELRGDTGERGRRAAAEAEAIARELDDPGLLALALNARFMHAFARTGMAGERDRIGAELVDLAAKHDLVTVEVLGHLIRLQAACARGEFDAADRHAAAADRLAGRYELPVVGVFTELYAALRLAVAGRSAVAGRPVGAGRAVEDAYRTACARLAGSGMPGMSDGLLGLALLSIGRDGGDVGPYEPWVRPGRLLAAGRRDEAARAVRELPESPHDLLWEARLCLAARAVAELGDREAAARLYDELLPAAGELAGAGSGIVSFGTVDDHLAVLRNLL
ncbi:AAA family ATPase [Couchioplanes caeruleus]|uniref:BTAD domain-containing putative transcriptional regulator n=1 Tax=Couchioplanes caeruleus TaxID=56438 RepID=UPI0020BDED89|nr:BTAD domain-containing putative transcriptional regulator [Couchioplanes caeruleus]UQU61951.1 AAA family ATPase [Couchioplanes caeruleus]